MLVQPIYIGLEVYAATSDEQDAIAARIGGSMGEGNLFLIGSDGSSFVMSGPPAWHEDEGSYRDPSFFEPMLML